MTNVTTRYYCDFCGAENIQNQFTNIRIGGSYSYTEMACPYCCQQLRAFMAKLKESGVHTSDKHIGKPKWWEFNSIRKQVGART